MSRIIFDVDMPVLQILRLCGGFYERPEIDGAKKGPIVAYAAEYEPGRNWVGEIYANFGKAEEHPHVLEHFCKLLAGKIPENILQQTTALCGAPLGGLATAYQLALLCDKRYVFAEKRVIELAEGGKREKSELIWGRHEVVAGDQVAIIEDVTNNFSTTNTLVKLINDAGGNVTAIISLLNRSLEVDEHYMASNRQTLPVVSLVRQKIPQYRQDDPYVAEDVGNGNVVWKPKAEWTKLEAAMSAA